MNELALPAVCLVMLMGASSSGKSTFAAKHFGPFETISSDYCRGLVSNDVNNQSATTPAFELLHTIVDKRLAAGLLTVVDATNTQASARASLVALAKAHDVLPVAIVFDLPAAVLLQRHDQRTDRAFGRDVIRRQCSQLHASIKNLGREGFRHINVLTTPQEVDDATIIRTRLFNDLRDDHGPFDIIGDVHGCLDELVALLGQLGYQLQYDDTGRPIDATNPDGRRVIFLGDVTDRGPNVVDVLRLSMGMTANGHALAIMGNHEHKLVRALERRPVSMNHGLPETIEAVTAEGQDFTSTVLTWCQELISHYVLDDGRLVVAHAGLKQAYQGRTSGRVRAFALYGDTTGESDEYGLPVRYPWANEYRGKAMVVYGHTPIVNPEWINNTICIDTGCVFGGALTALRYPEKQLVTVPAGRVYAEPRRPIASNSVGRVPDQLDITDVLGKRVISTRLLGNVTIQADQAAGALEVISRFAAAPARLVYLPPTMSPVAASSIDGYLEHPADAFSYFAAGGATTVMCEEKHMGSRAVALIRRGGGGIVHTRTGRPFFDAPTEATTLTRLDDALARSGLWDELDADWVLIDAELLPWRLKAAAMIDEQYWPVATSAAAMYGAAIPALEQAMARGLDLAQTLSLATHQRDDAAAYGRVIERFGADGPVRIAPFQILACTGTTLYDRPHTWHMAAATQLAQADPDLIIATKHIAVDLKDANAVADATTWWSQIADDGAEGMVVKPMTSPHISPKGLLQPGLKVRGREYLRITYGPDYLDRLDDLRRRNVARKRSLALREYALGLQAVDLFTADAPLWRVHECVCAVLALESDPVDPRL